MLLPDPIPQHQLRERIRRLGEELNDLSRAIHEELDWRDKLYPVADDEEDSTDL